MTDGKAKSLSPRLRPDLGCQRLAMAAASLAKAATGLDWKSYAVPETDGSVLFRFSSGSILIDLAWKKSPVEAQAMATGLLSIIEMNEKGFERAVCAALRKTLEKALETDLYSPYAFPPIAEEPLNFDRLSRILSEQWLEKGRAGWFDYRVSGIERSSYKIRVSYTNGDRRVTAIIFDRVAVLRLIDRRLDKEALLGLLDHPGQLPYCAQTIRIAIDGDERTEEERGRPEQQVERALVFALERLAPELSAEAAEISPEDLAVSGVDGDDISSRITDGDRPTPGALDAPPDVAWRQFMAEDQFDYFISTSFAKSTDKVCYLSHSDRACISMRPQGAGEFATLYRCPWSASYPARTRAFSTELGDADVISDGGEGKLEKLLAYCAETGAEDQLIFFLPTCIPKLLGQDLEDMKARVEKSYGAAIIDPYPSVSFVAHEDTNIAIFRRLAEMAPNCGRSAEAAVNLVGFNPGREMDELGGVLEGLGIRLNACLLPKMDLAHVRRLKAAWLQVFLPYVGWAGLYEAVFKPLDAPWIIPAAPFGIENSAAWFEKISHEVGKADLWAEYMEREGPGMKERLEELKEETRGLKLGFVADMGQLSRIWNGERNFGLSPLSFLREFGFGLKAYVHEASGEASTRRIIGEAVEKAIIEKGHESDDLGIFFFANEKELGNLLKSDRAQAVFSEVTFDERLVEAGKAGFSLDDFEKGFAGAFRSCRRLISLCKTPYYSRLSEAMKGEG